MMSNLPPGTLILIGALLVPFVKGRARIAYTIGMPILSTLHLLWAFPLNHVLQFEIFDQTLTPVRVDRLSLVWGYLFHVAAVLSWMYAAHVRNRTEHFVAMVYVGSSIGCVFAGDLLTLFVYWEMTAIPSAFLVWSGATRASFQAGLRYVGMHVVSGVLVLSAALLLYVERGSLGFGPPNRLGMFRDLSSAGEVLLLLGFGIKAAFPLLHWWLPDAYPQSSVSGIVFLSAFTTKMAIYALTRGFSGCEMLIVIGATMALFPLVQAVLEADMRKSLVYVLNNQLGFMVVGIGVGTELAINGVAALACAHVLYKSLLFMAVGTVLLRIGSARQSELGGLWHRMPWTCGCCMVGALSVVPLNCGFVTKSLVMTAVAEEHRGWVWGLLMFAAVGTFLVVGIKVPYFTFFAPAARPCNELRPASRNMLMAMATTSACCVLIGVFPGLLYRMLPYAMTYHPYAATHVVQQLQLLSFTLLGFAVAYRLKIYPSSTAVGLHLSSVRIPKQFLRWTLVSKVSSLQSACKDACQRARRWMDWQCSEAGGLGGGVSTNVMAVSAVLLLAIYLMIYY